MNPLSLTFGSSKPVPNKLCLLPLELPGPIDLTSQTPLQMVPRQDAYIPTASLESKQPDREQEFVSFMLRRISFLSKRKAEKLKPLLQEFYVTLTEAEDAFWQDIRNILPDANLVKRDDTTLNTAFEKASSEQQKALFNAHARYKHKRNKAYESLEPSLPLLSRKSFKEGVKAFNTRLS